MSAAAFGLRLLAEPQPPGAWGAATSNEPSLTIREVDARTVERSWSGFAEIGWQAVIDGAPFTVERGRGGDHRFTHGEAPHSSGTPAPGTRAVHHLDAGAEVLLCSPTQPTDPSWWRLVLDSVLFTVALLRGYEALHAGAIATSEGVIAITAASGGGKSTLLAELIKRGSTLMADDVLVLEPRGSEAPLAHPGPPLMTVPVLRGEEALSAHAITRVGDEDWIAVPVHPGPLPLRALVVLDRRPNFEGATIGEISSPLAPLMDSLMAFPVDLERQRARFDLASVIAATTKMWKLEAASDAPPGEVADLLMAGV